MTTGMNSKRSAFDKRKIETQQVTKFTYLRSRFVLK